MPFCSPLDSPAVGLRHRSAERFRFSIKPALSSVVAELPLSALRRRSRVAPDVLVAAAKRGAHSGVRGP